MSIVQKTWAPYCLFAGLIECLTSQVVSELSTCWTAAVSHTTFWNFFWGVAQSICWHATNLTPFWLLDSKGAKSEAESGVVYTLVMMSTKSKPRQWRCRKKKKDTGYYMDMVVMVTFQSKKKSNKAMLKHVFINKHVSFPSFCSDDIMENLPGQVFCPGSRPLPVVWFPDATAIGWSSRRQTWVTRASSPIAAALQTSFAWQGILKACVWPMLLPSNATITNDGKFINARLVGTHNK